MKQRTRKVLPIRTRDARGMSGRDGAIDFAARTAALSNTSEKSIEDAIGSAISRAGRTLRNLRWFEVARTSGHITNGAVAHYQVTLKVGFTMEGPH